MEGDNVEVSTTQLKEVIGDEPRCLSMIQRIARNVGYTQRGVWVKQKVRGGGEKEVYRLINHFDIDEAIDWYEKKINTDPRYHKVWNRYIRDMKRVRKVVQHEASITK